ncbi:hypothetical protein LOTGIDRAFT_197570 [Lottia gigantea]|uniref:Sialin n=1 Tax=Lottia gigantea TaxID=225164 RepID=V3YYJ7_LOTGI|nr:hypothetical protein LOTGIDRAFT_197570 [Lottia gigantea]ESO83218.1 hypothetical protein LOTGIDRAFT_197570 [Lottia gigantea]
MMSSLGFLIIFCLRSNLSVALVAMTFINESMTNKLINQSSECPAPYLPVHNETDIKGEFEWNEDIQGIILGSFYYGYFITQIPGGWLAQYIGGKHLVGFSTLVTSILTILSPFAARYHWTMLMAVRILEGAVQGVTYPAMHAMWGRWAPKSERSKLVSITYSGAGSGTTIGLLASGYLCEWKVAGGWPATFYIFGSIGCVWFIIWTILIYDLPEDHPRISASELQLLKTTTSSLQLDDQNKPPWKSILSSSAVWGIVAAHVANEFGFFSLSSCLPTYMKYILNYDIMQVSQNSSEIQNTYGVTIFISSDGFLSALPYMVLLVLTLVGGQVADIIRMKQWLSTGSTRKLMNTIGLLVPASLMLVLGYVNCDSTLAVALLTAAVGMTGLTSAGYSCNHLDIAPQFAGVLMGLTNMLGTSTGFIGPYIVSLLTDNNQTRKQWQKFFYIVSGIYAAGGILFLFVAQGEEQIWSIKATLKQQKREKTFSVQNPAEDDEEN